MSSFLYEIEIFSRKTQHLVQGQITLSHILGKFRSNECRIFFNFFWIVSGDEGDLSWSEK